MMNSECVTHCECNVPQGIVTWCD